MAVPQVQLRAVSQDESCKLTVSALPYVCITHTCIPKSKAHGISSGCFNFGQVVGASGAVMGFVGLTIADLTLNCGEWIHVLLRLIIILAAVIFFIVTAVTKVGDKTISHDSKSQRQ